jgi:hypothetical protein
MSDRVIRAAGLAAVLFVVLILISAFVAGAPPSADASADKIRAFLVDHRSALLISNFLGLLAIPLVVWFVVVLREVVLGDRLANALGTAAVAGILITAPMAMAGGAISVSPLYADGVAGKLGDDTVRIVFEAQNLLFASTSAGIVLFAVAAALAIRRSGALPAYTMWVGLLAAALNVVAMFSTLSAGASGVGFLGLIGFALFLLVAGGTMAAGKARPALQP